MASPIVARESHSPVVTEPTAARPAPSAEAAEKLTSDDKLCVLGGVMGLLFLSAGGVNEGAHMLQQSCSGRAAAGLAPGQGGVAVRGRR